MDGGGREDEKMRRRGKEKGIRVRIFGDGEICGVNEKEGSVEQRVPGQREDSLPRAEVNSPERQVQFLYSTQNHNYIDLEHYYYCIK